MNYVLKENSEEIRNKILVVDIPVRPCARYAYIPYDAH
jgi:hypothetical protein